MPAENPPEASDSNSQLEAWEWPHDDFEAFANKSLKGRSYNNFMLHFYRKDGDIMSQIYQQQGIFELLQTDHPQLASQLREKVTRLYGRESLAEGTPTRQEWIDEVEPLLFIAYQILRTKDTIRDRLKKRPHFLTA